jgi:hypothetical protein
VAYCEDVSRDSGSSGGFRVGIQHVQVQFIRHGEVNILLSEHEYIDASGDGWAWAGRLTAKRIKS